MKPAQKAMRFRNPSTKACERSAHAKPDHLERCRPFLRFTRLEYDEDNMVPASNHAFGECDDLAFGAASPERG
jgi:hypothetical protein